MITNPISLLALVAGFCAVAQMLAWKFKLPSILFLLLAGITLGPITGLLDPDLLFGDLLFPFVSLSVAIILFEGGLTLDLKKIKGHGSVVRKLLTVGVFITWCLMSITVHYLFGFDWPLACLFGSIGVVTGPTVIKPLLRTVRPREKIEKVLHWEGILVDPLGAFLAILVFQYILESSGGGAAAQIAIVLTKLVVVGLVMGCLAGSTVGALLGRHMIPDYLKEAITLISVIVAFAISESIQHESGLLTVTVMGAWLGNSKKLRLDEIMHFKENLSILLISTLFILLAARLELNAIAELGGAIVVFLLIVQLIIRPLSIWVCTLGSDWTWQEKVLAGWIAPRGIVAAAISSLFVIRLESENVEGVELLIPLAFVLIIGTVVIQSLSAKPLGDRLKVTNPAPNGILIVGGNPVSLALIKALAEEEVKCVLVDRSQRNIIAARRLGVKAYHGNPTSGHADENLPVSGIGAVIAMTRNAETNALALVHFRTAFGTERVFALALKPEESTDKVNEPKTLSNADNLFGPDVTYELLADRLAQGATIATLTIDDSGASGGALEILETDNQIPLIAIDPNGFTHVYGAGREFTPEAGWRVLVLQSIND